MVGWFNFELKPRTARHFHLRHEVQPAIRFNTLDAPEIQSVASYQRVRITATPAEPHTTHKKIEESSNPPQKTGKVPTVRTSNPLDGSEGQGGWDGHVYDPGIDEPGPESNTAPGRGFAA